MAERKAVIKNADMSEDMQQDAVDCASQVCCVGRTGWLGLAWRGFWLGGCQVSLCVGVGLSD